ncbi:MAG TPA: hypothetical protein VI306_05060 [Pyrinomonadaceae bacterium]
MKTLFILASIMVLFLSDAVTSQAQTLAVKKQLVDKFVSTGLLTQANVNKCGGVSKILSIKNIDLNKDRKPEFIATFACPLELSEPTYVMRKTANGIDIIYEGGYREFLTPLKTYTNGWRNLRSFSYSAGSGESGSVTLRYNGSEYKQP